MSGAGVVLMHSTTNAMGLCPEGLDKLISYYKSSGYMFTSVRRVLPLLVVAWQGEQGVCCVRVRSPTWASSAARAGVGARAAAVWHVTRRGRAASASVFATCWRRERGQQTSEGATGRGVTPTAVGGLSAQSDQACPGVN
jgi:hypothetical protein